MSHPPTDHSHPHDHHHGHHHDHEHSHLDPMEVRVRALHSLLTQKGYVEAQTIDRIIETYETEVGPHNGAQVVARAWTDAAYREWLARDATAAIAEMGYSGRQGEHMVALFNDESVHHMVVCTLCSCYPWPVLGLPPVWYKSAPYRSQVVMQPRAVLAQFGVSLPESVRVQVWDSTAEVRYLVIPRRPEGSDQLSVAELAALVTRDSMIGTGLALPVASLSAQAGKAP